MLIAQITDTHIKPEGRLAYHKVDTAAALERCVQHLNSIEPRIDLVLVTGDLVDAGQADEYALLKDLLAPLHARYYLIPGNHDDRGALRAAFPEHAYLRDGGEFVQYVLDHYPLRLIGLDTTVPGEPWGEMCARRLEWLDARLAEAPGRATVLFMHHPPFVTGIEHMDVQNCRNAAALGAVLERHPQVIRILCGHVHRSIYVAWHGVPASIAPSPSHAVALDLRDDGPSAFVLEPPACHLHFWNPEAGFISHSSFIGEYGGPHPFYDHAGRLID